MKVMCDRKNGYYSPNMKLAFDLQGEQIRIWRELYKKLIVFSSNVESYISKEMAKVGDLSDAIGILLRGTDYTALKPKGHPIQPDIEEVLNKADELKRQMGYKRVYVATDEKELLNQVISKFGEESIVVNERRYFDSYYKMRSGSAIGEVHFDRENDNFLKGLEYLSSLNILAKCDAFVAGNCGGTYYTLLIPNKYKHVFIFNRGLYK